MVASRDTSTPLDEKAPAPSLDREHSPNSVLVICNAYPSDSALYRNGFIHRRVKGYQAQGLNVDVFYQHDPAGAGYDYIFDGVSVRVGDQARLTEIAREDQYAAYLVHFAEPARIEPLRRADIHKPIIVWVHGFEAEAWYRRWFNFIGTANEIRAALEKRDLYFAHQNNFFADLINDDSLDLTFVNVSQWFQEFIVEPDVEAKFSRSFVIPNLVDDHLFPYRHKDASYRKKILSIRPYSSHKYANDQTVQAVVELSQRPYFEDLEFCICGSGPLFESTTAPIRKLDNVTLVNRFLSQAEIAEMHSNYGVFLCPTRFDSQGVSMCEAVSSGLVAVSTAVAAIPEYIHHGATGLLAPPEDPLALADNIERLYFDEELFHSLSRAGSVWMSEHCGFGATVAKEIDLITHRIGASNGGK